MRSRGYALRFLYLEPRHVRGQPGDSGDFEAETRANDVQSRNLSPNFVAIYRIAMLDGEGAVHCAERHAQAVRLFRSKA